MKTVIEMAEDVGAYVADLPLEDAVLFEVDILSGRSAKLEAFAELVRAEENKACQDVCDDVYRAWTLRDDEDEIAHPDPIDCKLAIRARGNT